MGFGLMVDLIISGITTMLCLIGCSVYLKFQIIMEKHSVTGIFPQNVKQTMFGIGMLISSLAVFLALNFIYDVTWIFTIKRIVLCVALWPISLIDYRKHIIPNQFVFSLAIIRVLLCIPEFITNVHSAKTECISCLIASAAIVFVLCVMRLIIKEGIGFGDIKLFAVIGLLLGVNGSISTIFMSFVVSFVASIYLLVTKKKNKKDQIAFGPSILIGTLFSVIIFGA